MNFKTFLLAIFASLQVHSRQDFVFPVLTVSDAIGDCLQSILRDCEAQNVNFICDANSTFCPTHVIHHVQFTAWTLFNSSENMQLNFYKAFICVLATKYVANMIVLLAQFKICHKSNIILILPVDVPPHLPELEELFSQAWNLGIIDVVILLSSPLYCRVYSYIPFSPGRCYDTSPKLVNYWKVDSASKITSKVNYFPDNKIPNLHACRLIIQHVDNSVLPLAVYWQPVMDYLEKAMKSLNEMQPTTNLRLPLAHSNTTNVVLTYLEVKPYIAQSYIYPSFFVTNVLVLAIPSRRVFAVGWFRLLKELSVPVWYGVMLSFAVFVIVFYIVLKGQKDLVFIALLCLRPMLNVPIPVLPLQGRTHLFPWLLLCFVLSSSYLSSLLSKLTAPFTEHSINNIVDFLKSDLVIYVPRATFFLLEPILSRHPRYQPLIKKIVLVNTTFQFRLDKNRNDGGYVIKSDQFYTFFRGMPYRILPNEDIESGLNSVLILVKPSPYERIFKMAYLRIAEAGVFDFIRIRQLREKAHFKRFQPTRVKGPTSLSLRYFAAVFAIWSVGCILACFVFSFEYCYSRYTS